MHPHDDEEDDNNNNDNIGGNEMGIEDLRSEE